MERVVSHEYTELIQAGFDLIPPKIADKLRHIHFFTGSDPIYAGLFVGEESSLGRSHRDTWCVAYPQSQSIEDKHTTVVMPTLIPRYSKKLRPVMVVHELGHCLDELLGFEHLARPVTKYAKRNRMEAFADAFTYWLFPGYEEYYTIIDRLDDKTVALFSQLTKGVI